MYEADTALKIRQAGLESRKTFWAGIGAGAAMLTASVGIMALILKLFGKL